MPDSYRILLAGNPNVGKSTIFNALTGLKQHTGNWAGKTVDLAHGSFRQNGNHFLVQDLPGTYSILSDSPEEKIARDAICFSPTDLVLVIADATCLERNLNLILQIAELTPHTALCINLLDEAKRKSISINLTALQEHLGIPVIGISARQKKDIRRLKCFIEKQIRYPEQTSPVPIEYSNSVEKAITSISKSISGLPFQTFSQRFTAVKILEGNTLSGQLLDTFALTSAQRARIIFETEKIRNKLKEEGITPHQLQAELTAACGRTSCRIYANCSAQAPIPNNRSIRADQILTSRLFGIPIILGFLALLLWITIAGANYPSQLLMKFFSWLKPYLSQVLSVLHIPSAANSLFIDGIYYTAAWVTSVMLPPMMIFFPLFTLLEDLGYLPRLAFNLDRFFQKAGSCGKQALTMCMGLGCNAVGVTGCRIISSPRERLAAMITNCFMPCNGRFSLLITLSTIYIGSLCTNAFSSVAAAGFVLLLIVFGILITLLLTRLLTWMQHSAVKTPFTLELPPFRKPQITQTLIRSLLDRTLHILSRALRVSAPAGAVIWLLANQSINGTSLLHLCAGALDPFARLMGLDGMILLAFLLALPANEIVLPIILMGYLTGTQLMDTASITSLSTVLAENGWTVLTAVNVMLFSLLHFPCATTLWTIKKETGSLGWTALAFLIPSATAVVCCMLTTAIWNLCSFL
ncbi:ferrous iron transport protein B [Ructibacterium gallinarum]|uniref:Ferrous iron transport protein B n=1 Tax=Ructibacterium gallinarum TaxID=2779355 RepID=A0A9D5M2A5_9FIRM|nr:ferrous iron transport protein B [Ructibacterium gallinarum]MBE5040995.1 ferrous iron transport protein B [Ructibacterium gallinarum]